MSKVFLLITSLAGGGAERVVSELSKNFSDNINYTIILLSNEICYPVNKKPLSLDLEFHSDNIFNIIHQMIRGIAKYRQILKSEKTPFYSISFLTMDNLINILSNIGNKNANVVISVHIALSMKFGSSPTGKSLKLLIRLLYKRADMIIAVSHGVKNELVNEFKLNEHKIKVIYNPVDINFIMASSQEEITDEEWFDDEIPLLINVGRLTKQKGQWHLIRAFKEVRKEFMCKLVIRGDGELKQFLEKLIIDLSLESDIKILGWKNNHYKYISKSCLFISSSLWEALPYVIIEAMACGCPEIATDCKYGPREILGNGEFGKLVPPMNGKLYNSSYPVTTEEKILANEILNILQDVDLRDSLSKKGLLRAKQFDLKASIDNYEYIINSEI
jgi:glycosyltransferase involved in cell wall biosynthesis